MYSIDVFSAFVFISANKQSWRSILPLKLDSYRYTSGYTTYPALLFVERGGDHFVDVVKDSHFAVVFTARKILEF